MKVLLCQSYLGPRVGEPLVFPLGIAYVASLIKDYHEVMCWDPNVSENPITELSSVLAKFNPDCVGLSLRNIDSVFSFKKRSYYPQFVEMIRRIKERQPLCKLVVGGSGFSLFAEEIINRNTEIDFGIVSEGEHSFANLLKNFEHPERVQNMVFRKNNKIVATEKSRVDFEFLPSPSRELFKLEKYRNALYSIGVQSKRGCAFHCVFCSKRIHGGVSCRLRSPLEVVDEIEELVKMHDIKSCFFVDSTFNYPVEHYEKICQEIIRRRLDVQWTADFRPDYINENLMKLAVKARCSWFSFSPDGASDNAMQMLGKNFGVAQVEKTVELAKRTEGANVGYSFLYDLPFYNREQTLGLLRLIPKMILRCRTKLRYVTLSRIRIYPRTMFFKIAVKQGKISKNTDLIYPVHYKSGSAFNIDSSLPYLLRNWTFLHDKLIKKRIKSRDNQV